MVDKRYVAIMMALFCSFTLCLGNASASEHEKEELEHVIMISLHQKIVEAMKEHYGGITQFHDLELVNIVSRNLPADLKDDSAFKSAGTVYDLIVQLQAIVGEGKEEKVTIILSNEFVSSGFDVVSFKVDN